MTEPCEQEIRRIKSTWHKQPDRNSLIEHSVKSGFEAGKKARHYKNDVILERWDEIQKAKKAQLKEDLDWMEEIDIECVGMPKDFIAGANWCNGLWKNKIHEKRKEIGKQDKTL